MNTPLLIPIHLIIEVIFILFSVILLFLLLLTSLKLRKIKYASKANPNANSSSQNEAKYKIIADHISDMIRIVDVNGICSYASPSHKKILGFDPEFYIQQQMFFKIIHPEDVAVTLQHFNEMVKLKKPKSLQFRIILENGRQMYLEEYGTPVIGENGLVEQIVFLSRDITEKKKAEQEFAGMEAKCRVIAENMTDLIGIINPDGLISYVTKSELGYDEQSMVDTSCFDYIHPEDLDHAKTSFQEILQTKKNKLFQFKLIDASGETIEVDCMATPVIGEDGEIESVIVVSRDITEKVKIIKELQISEERYRRLIELFPQPIISHRDGILIYSNTAGLRLIGASHSDEIMGAKIADIIELNNQEKINHRIGLVMENYDIGSMEMKIRRLDGILIDVETTGIYDAKNHSVMTVINDITKRKKIENQLKDSEQRFRKLVELSPETVFVHSDYKFDYVNPAGLAMFRVNSPKDMIGKPVLERVHPSSLEDAERRLKTIYDLHLSTPLTEQKLLRYDGSAFDSDLIAVPIFHNGKRSSLTLIRDISEHKSLEKERQMADELIRQSEEHYSSLQTSVDRIFHDLFGVMKVSEMERRIIKEVKDVIKVNDVSLIHVDIDNNIVIKDDCVTLPHSYQEKLLKLREIPVCKLMDTVEGHLLKIAEIQGKSYVLWIGEKPESLTIAPNRVWLQTIARYVSVLFDNFRLIEDLTNELEETASNLVAPPWMVRLLFNLSENERKRLSQDLHDGALQEQIIWYRKIDELSSNNAIPQELQQKLSQITQGLLDVIYQIRLTCNELRPPMLKEEGLVSSLEALFDFTQLRVDYSIQFDTSTFKEELNDDVLLGMYRIVQELLSNATKHSKASDVHLSLSSHTGYTELLYKDNGVGLNLSVVDQVSFQSMGITGMKERVRSMEGKMEFDSTMDNGLKVKIMIPNG
jgi:two-component system sensor histidine kinase ComP